MSGALQRHPGLNLGPAHPDTHKQAVELLFGFWVFLMSDAIIFGVLFATYAAMRSHTAGGPSPHDLYDIHSAFAETFFLLTSSFTFGMASLSLKHHSRPAPMLLWLGVTLCCAGVFIGLEIHDFLSAIAKGGLPTRSSYLSSYFALVSLHGLHVTTGSIWMLALMAQIRVHGIDGWVKLGILRLGLFWHFLDIVWIGIFSVVYLGGLT